MLSKGLEDKTFLRRNTTILYASLISQICLVRQAGKLLSQTLSSAICVSQNHLTSDTQDRGAYSIILQNHKKDLSGRN